MLSFVGQLAAFSNTMPLITSVWSILPLWLKTCVWGNTTSAQRLPCFLQNISQDGFRCFSSHMYINLFGETLLITKLSINSSVGCFHVWCVHKLFHDFPLEEGHACQPRESDHCFFHSVLHISINIFINKQLFVFH